MFTLVYVCIYPKSITNSSLSGNNVDLELHRAGFSFGCTTYTQVAFNGHLMSLTYLVNKMKMVSLFIVDQKAVRWGFAFAGCVPVTFVVFHLILPGYLVTLIRNPISSLPPSVAVSEKISLHYWTPSPHGPPYMLCQ